MYSGISFIFGSPFVQSHFHQLSPILCRTVACFITVNSFTVLTHSPENFQNPENFVKSPYNVITTYKWFVSDPARYTIPVDITLSTGNAG